MRMRKGDGYEIPCVGSRASQARRLGSRPGKGQGRAEIDNWRPGRRAACAVDLLGASELDGSHRTDPYMCTRAVPTRGTYMPTSKSIPTSITSITGRKYIQYINDMQG